MRTRFPLAFGLVTLLLAAAACSSNTPTPAPVRNYGPEASSTTGGAGPQAPRPAYRAPTAAPRGPAQAGAIRWHTRLADAQAEARSTGKLILVTSTKPRCSLCDKFKNQIAPAAGGELTRVAVGYIYDITRPEVRQVDRLLRANLRGADLMPLVGFVTADLRWVHGFWGQRSVQQFRGDIARAASVRSAAIAAPSRAQAPRMATVSNYSVINEFGEREWSAPGDVWPEGDPEPIDAITGEPVAIPGAPGGLPGRVGPTAMPSMDGRRLADVSPAPPAPPLSISDRPRALPARPVAVVPAVPTEPSIREVLGARARGTYASTPLLAAIPAIPAATPARRDGLAQALDQIRAGDFDRARDTLTRVREQATDATVVREASKGGIALYNAKRIRFATSGGERSRYLARARRDFGNSMWAPLFNS